jgi:hypothetical protein
MIQVDKRINVRDDAEAALPSNVLDSCNIGGNLCVEYAAPTACEECIS